MNDGPVFPLELLEAVIDHLHNDFPALRACSLASRDLLPLTRAHLFSTITVLGIQSVLSRGVGYAPFLRSRGPLCVCNSPHLSLYVDELHILDAGMRYPVVHYIRLDHDNFIGLLKSLSQLRALRMSNFGLGHQWTYLPVEIRAAFETTFALPTLTQLSLSASLHIDPTFFSHPSIRGIQHLQVLSVLKETPPISSVVESSQAQETSQRTQLRSLDISFVPDEIVSSLSNAIDPAGLTHMSIRGFRDRDEKFSEWKMLACVPFLTHLKIHAWRSPNHPITPAPDVLDFGPLTYLRSLYIVVTFSLPGPARPPPGLVARRVKANRNPLPWLIQVLQTLGTSNSMLEDVKIVLDIESVPELPKLELEEWGELDILLSNLQVPSLTIQASDPAAAVTLSPFARDTLPELWGERGERLNFQSLDEEMINFVSWRKR